MSKKTVQITKKYFFGLFELFFGSLKLFFGSIKLFCLLILTSYALFFFNEAQNNSSNAYRTLSFELLVPRAIV